MILAICLSTVTGAETSTSIFVVSMMRVSPPGEPNSVRLTDQARSLTRRVGHPLGMYLNPPRRAVVFSFDEKTQCQAMDRTQPSLPMVPGRAGTMTHDHRRNGTTDLFAAMNVATGEVLSHCQKGTLAGTS